jgi:protein ImuA
MNRAETLQHLTWLCRNGRAVAAPIVEASGWTELDAVLPGGGWQAGTIVELMPAASGIGELRLLLPALARITGAGRHVTLIAPPYIPFAPALAQHGVLLERLLVIQAQQAEDILWAAEQSLRCRSFGAVLAWPAATIKDREIRRLQLAAEAGGSTGFLYRCVEAACESSPAALRLKLQRVESALQIDVVKCRGGRSGQSVKVEAPCSGCA